MTLIASVDMDEVARLTRAGRLLDATALLQAGLGGGPLAARRHAPRPDVDRDPPGAGDPPSPRLVGTIRSPKATPVRRERKTWPLDLEPVLKAPHVDRTLSVPPGASFDTSTVTNAAGTLTTKVYRPSHLGEDLAPLVVMLHGCTQSPDDFAVGTRMNELAEQYGFFVAYPAQAKSANASKCWNWFRDGDQRRDRGEPSLIADATRQILSTHPVDPRRVFVAGLSAGGAAAAIMGCAYPDLYAGVGVHSGLACGAASDLPSALRAMQRGGGRKPRPSSSVPTIVFHGDADRTVGPSNADEVSEQVAGRSDQVMTERGATAAGRRYARTVRHDANGRATSEQWMIEGGGHAWFGGNPQGSYADPDGPDASREMLRFFGIV